MKTPLEPSPPLADWIVIPVYNRRETTLACLRALADDGVFGWAAVIVVDDGSTDGTAAAIRTQHPAVHLLDGDGNWWWAGAIRRGMQHALAQGAARVYWLNDDCRPPPGGMRALRDGIETNDTVAWIEACTPSGWTYGAHRKTAWSIRRCTAEEERNGKIDTFSGNCVGLPRGWVERVGLPDDACFPHGLADLDYGLRLKAAGAPLRALPGFVAISAEPPVSAGERWRSTSRPMREIWREFSSPRSVFYFLAWRHFAFRHWGPLWGPVVFAAPYVRWAMIAAMRAAFPRRAPQT